MTVKYDVAIIGGGHNGHPTSYYPPYKNVKIEGEKDQYLTDLIIYQALFTAM